MRKAILLLIIFFISILYVFAEVAYPVKSSIPVVWELGTVDIEEKAIVTLHNVAENESVGEEISALPLKISGIRASGKFYISLEIVSRDIVNINVRALSDSEENPGSLANADGTRSINWTLNKQSEADPNSFETVINGENYTSSKRVYDHYPSSEGLVSKKDILVEFETDTFKMADIDDTYSTKLIIEIVDVGGR